MEVCTYRADWCMLPKYGLWRKIAGKSLERVCHSCQSWKCFEVTTMNKITSNSTKHAILNDVLNQISILFSSQETWTKKIRCQLLLFSQLVRYSWFSTKLDSLRCFFSLIGILMLLMSNWNGWMLTAIAETYRFLSWNLKVTTTKSYAVVWFGLKKSWNKSNDIVTIKSPCSFYQDITNYCSMLITKNSRILTLKVNYCFNDVQCQSKCLGSWYFMCGLCERY